MSVVEVGRPKMAFLTHSKLCKFERKEEHKRRLRTVASEVRVKADSVMSQKARGDEFYRGLGQLCRITER